MTLWPVVAMSDGTAGSPETRFRGNGPACSRPNALAPRRPSGDHWVVITDSHKCPPDPEAVAAAYLKGTLSRVQANGVSTTISRPADPARRPFRKPPSTLMPCASPRGSSAPNHRVSWSIGDDKIGSGRYLLECSMVAAQFASNATPRKTRRLFWDTRNAPCELF
jgi:hypothetical protein